MSTILPKGKGASGVALMGLCGVLAAGAYHEPSRGETFHTYDPATMAQGGTGVAITDQASNSLMNPASLAVMPDSADFSSYTSVSARAFDEDDLIGEIEDFDEANYIDDTESSITDTEDALQAYASNETASTRQDAADALRKTAGRTRDLNAGIQSLAGKPLEAEFASAVGASRPSHSFGFALTYNAWGTIGGIATFNDEFLSDFASTLDNCATKFESDNEEECFLAASTYLTDDDGDGIPETVEVDPSNDLNSKLLARGIGVQEVGLTIARRFGTASRNVAIGITPTRRKVEVFDYAVVVDDNLEEKVENEEFTEERFRKEYSDFNMDFGAMFGFGALNTGLTVRNVVTREYETALGQTIQVEPQVRGGVAYDGSWYRLAADFDITENGSSAFGSATRFVSVGGTLDLFGWVQLRGGYRWDTAGGVRDVASVGLGLSPFQVLRAEIGVAGNEKEVGGSARVGLTF